MFTRNHNAALGQGSALPATRARQLATALVAMALLLLGLALWSWQSQSHNQGPHALASDGDTVWLGVNQDLWVLNRHSDLDMWFVYFIGAYGMGMLAYWGKSSNKPWAWSALLLVLGLVSLEIDFRLRIAVAFGAAVALLWLMRVRADDKLGAWLADHVAPLRWLQSLGQISYSVFLVHFSIVVLCNAVVSHLWPTQPWLNWLGMCIAFALSVLAGRVLYHFVEARTPSLKGVARWELGLVTAGLAVSLLSARLSM